MHSAITLAWASGVQPLAHDHPAQTRTMDRFNRTTGSQATPVPPSRRNPQRITITINWQTHQSLLNRSDWEGRSLSNLAAHLLESGLTAN